MGGREFVGAARGGFRGITTDASTSSAKQPVSAVPHSTGDWKSSRRAFTPNSYFINCRNGVASSFGIDPINDFVHSVRHKAPYPVTAVDGLAASRIGEAVYRSLESGKPENVLSNGAG